MVKRTGGPCDGTFLEGGVKEGLRCDEICGLRRGADRYDMADDAKGQSQGRDRVFGRWGLGERTERSAMQHKSSE